VTNLARNLTTAAKEHGGRPAVRLDDLVLTYDQLLDGARRVTSLLRSSGVGPGDRVGLVLPNVPAFTVLFYGALAAGAVVVPMNPLLKAREVRYYLEDSGASVVFAWEAMADEAAKAAGSVGIDCIPVEAAGFLELLAEHQPAQDRVRAELADHPGPVSLLGHRDTLPWTRSVIDEALRLFPPAWALSRRSHQADVIGGHEVPAGTLVIMSPWLLHRRADSWTDPLVFRPERFLDAGAGRSGYLPFGQGPRLCIGREFALGEMVVVLSRLLAEHRIGLPPGWSRPAAQALVAVHPRGGMPLVVTRSDGGRG